MMKRVKVYLIGRTYPVRVDVTDYEFQEAWMRLSERDSHGMVQLGPLIVNVDRIAMIEVEDIC